MRTWFSELSDHLRREITGVLLIGLAVLGYVLLLSEGAGIVGSFWDRVLNTWFGQAHLLVPALVGLAGVVVLWGRSAEPATVRQKVIGLAIGFAVVLVYLHREFPLDVILVNGRAGFGGGLMGAALSWVLLQAFGAGGRTVIMIMGGVIALLLLTNLSLVATIQGSGRYLSSMLRSFWLTVTEFVYGPDTEEDADSDEPAAQTAAASDDAEPAVSSAHSAEASVFVERAPVVHHHFENEPEQVSLDNQSDPVPMKRQIWMPGDENGRRGGDPDESPPAAKGGRSCSGETAGQGGIDSSATAAGIIAPYRLPSLSMLHRSAGRPAAGSVRDGQVRARLLEETLESFGVKAKVSGIQQGPAITRYELSLGRGVKVSRVQNLANDIALSLAATDVRIEAPIPGKSAVGIEVPNREISAVSLRDVLATPEFRDNPSPLSFAVGKDIAGKPVVASLDRLLHVLIAGATGSGKSVCISALLGSLLFKAHPDQVKLLLIDPKVVELNGYNGIPHLLVPVITDAKRAAASLQWLVREMERRYEAFAEAGARDISRYNERLVVNGEPSLPYIVVVIDELADLMMVAPVDVEDAIQRLAQMARAAGIHLVVATQRPSVDVITGVIKANIPSRIAFSVSSQTDSRVILDSGGADKLVGKGDMLFYPTGASKPVRVQGCYISEVELETVLAWIRDQGEPEYNEDVLAASTRTARESPREADELFPEALKIVIEAGQASVSFLQRRLRVGYTRAGRLVDMMEERGFVGPHLGSKARDVRITYEDYHQLFEAGDEEK